MMSEPDVPRGEFIAGPETAPYPREWTTEQRAGAYWWALANSWTVEANPRAEDEGASGWHRVAAAMNRDQRRQRPPQLVAPTSRPDDEQPADPSEPRYPNPAEAQDNDLVTASPMETW